MILKLNFQDTEIAAVKTKYKSKTKNHYIRYVVDEYSIERAIEQIKGNKWVVALNYEGDIMHLNTLKELPSIPLIVSKEFTEINEFTIDFFVTQLPDWVRPVIKTPKDFCDMKLIEEASKKYPKLRFCGGKFLRLPQCNIGCIMREDIPSKIADSKISYYTDGCSCIIVTMPIEEAEGVEILYKDLEDKKEEEVKHKIEEVKNSRKIASLEDLLK